MSSPYPVLGDRPIDQWRVIELKDELKRRKLMTKGLKEDLVKRLDEAIRNEQETLNKDNGFGSVLQSEAQPEHETTEVRITENDQNTISISDTVTEEINVDIQSQVTCDQESSNLFVPETAKGPINHGDSINEKVIHPTLIVDINDSQSIEEEKVREGEGLNGSEFAGLEGKQVAQVTDEETSKLVSENLEPVVQADGENLQNIGTQNESSAVQAQLENDDSESLHVDAKDSTSDSNNQVSEVSPVLGFQVKCESISTETVSIIEKNELKDNIIADNVKLELDVKPEMVQPSSSSDVPEGGELHPMDVEEPHTKMVSVEETGGSNTESVDIVPKNGTGDFSSSEKVNAYGSSGDHFMEEDVTETKQMDSETGSEEMRTNAGLVETSALKDEGLVDIVGEDISAEKKVSNDEENNGPAAPSVKRKLNDQHLVGNTDVAKRQRRWNSEGVKVPETRTVDNVSTMPKDVFQPAFKRSLSRSESTISEEGPKERVVPPSTKPPTNSLRIDRFLRPFTLKAVQELLGKTGSIASFWMDHIKTHCYVSYSSVEEAVETRNAVYNLQWPTNGGRLLVAEFVDPQEVKVRLEAPPQSPATPVGSGASTLPIPQKVQPLPSPRPQVPKQQLPQPLPPPPPPVLSNPPHVRERPVREQLPPPVREHLPPVKERLTLPPPPPLPEKAEPPIVTLDDLFRKTKATPRIYYLPLSDEQVAEKLQSQGKTVKQ